MADDYAALCDPRPDVPDAPLFPAAMGEVLHAILHPKPQPGPPYVHTIRPPEPIGYDEQGRPIWEPEPAFTITDVSDD